MSAEGREHRNVFGEDDLGGILWKADAARRHRWPKGNGVRLRITKKMLAGLVEGKTLTLCFQVEEDDNI